MAALAVLRYSHVRYMSHVLWTPYVLHVSYTNLTTISLAERTMR